MNQLTNLQKVCETHKGDPNFMLSLARGMEVMLAFSERKTPLSISEAALKTGLDRAVVRRCVYTLVRIGMLETHGRKFALGTHVLSLGHAYFSSAEVITRAQPILDQLGREIHTNCALAILNDWEVVYMVRSQSRRLLSQSLGMGSRVPAHCTSLGRVLLADLPPSELDRYLRESKRQAVTQFTVTDAPTLRKHIAETRKLGYAIVDREMGAELIAIAVPVRIRSSNLAMALSVTTNPRYTPASQMKERYLASIEEAVKQLREI